MERKIKEVAEALNLSIKLHEAIVKDYKSGVLTPRELLLYSEIIFVQRHHLFDLQVVAVIIGYNH